MFVIPSSVLMLSNSNHRRTYHLIVCESRTLHLFALLILPTTMTDENMRINHQRQNEMNIEGAQKESKKLSQSSTNKNEKKIFTIKHGNRYVLIRKTSIMCKCYTHTTLDEH